MNIKTLYIIAAIATTLSCKHDAYETGDGDLSYMHADYADVTITNHTVSGITTDNDVSLLPPPGISVGQDVPNDTVLRRLLFYNMSDPAMPIELLRITPVSVLTPHTPEDEGTMRTDPVKLVSAWLSANKRYINLQLGIMTGKAADPASVRSLRFVCDSTHTAGRGHTFLTLRYDNAGTPEYYTEDLYISIPTSRIAPADTVTININTYSGGKREEVIVISD